MSAPAESLQTVVVAINVYHGTPIVKNLIRDSPRGILVCISEILIVVAIAAEPVATNGFMAKSSKHVDRKTERSPVQVPKAWLAVARKLAAANKQPVLWYLLNLIHAEAEEAGMTDLPPLPWDEAEE